MASHKALCFLLVLLLITVQGFAKQRCRPSSITASITKNGRVVGGLPEWDVVISNTCVCPQSVILTCVGFSAIAAQVDPKILFIVGNECLVKGGKPIIQGQPVKFTIVAKQPPSQLKPGLSISECP